ncbi:GNAT family N-acetyltransferase [Mycolicibacterium palauense]|uniref:GNAT family N-acetyltransferase n=1 Tax=Mycolicibacterium palauense TaxID=2034511 RepID=UPI001FE5B27A|nr:GNAT family N-acetyltransferase [Mycolicibacterium palauense]
MDVIDVRPARKADVRRLSSALGRAFFEDPVMSWMLPEPPRRAKGLPRMFATMVRHHFLGGGACEVAGTGDRIAAAALWDPPGRWKPSQLENLLMMPGFVRALGSQARRGEQVDALMKANHPDEPHWYLAVIGSDPAFRGGGFGHALMRSRLDRIDAEHAPAYLESSNADNIPYYQRFGFEVTGELAVPEGGPSLWPMWRQPR